ncbi:Putative GTP cyclohydrolase 1 type 2 [Planctomycetes bacterium Pan216]|uniref:GTP cyclohydrolase 1 type 2 homolog n=1 Tax=Kolteria novifilia TaxID=2527975 RepID=A0A518AYM6_9BACT|nr:Putative GTP cyclohydrolase 1 type 2 [Planctomycetes bacterium Pan216]
MKVGDIVSKLDEWFPSSLAEEWDNVGLLLGDRIAKVERIMTCLTVTPASAAEAVRRGVDLVVAHHPILFRGTKRLVADGPNGTVYQLARAGSAVYSPHTAFDSAFEGINAQIAARLQLVDSQAMRLDKPPSEFDTKVGTGRWGSLPTAMRLDELVHLVGETLGSPHMRFVGAPEKRVKTVAVACGAAAEMLADATRLGCDAFLTGEARFHDCLAAEADGVSLVLAGHYATERFALERLAERMAHEWQNLDIWASQEERDPIRRL